jgi:transposase, IS30 family
MAKHLTIGQRYQLSIYRHAKSQKEIAELLHVSESTVSRELGRNRKADGSYEPQFAQSQSRKRRANKNAVKIKADLEKQVVALIQTDYSPEQVRGTLLKTQSCSLSVQGIYNYIWKDAKQGGTLHTHLRLGRKNRKKYGKPDKRKLKYKNKPSIETRPAVVDAKTRIGDWEADTVEGAHKSGYVVTLTERFSKTAYIIPVRHKTKEAVRKAIVKRLKKTNIPVKTITFDNGTEFDDYKRIAIELRCEVYFAHPYSPWERGLNENTNGLIRQYFPKKMDFSNIQPQDTKRVEEILNNRPRKKLDFYTPNQIVEQYILNQKIASQT